MANALKSLVSKKKIRYKKDGFNLDLTYINDRVIAMGFPSENVESIYRNSLDEVRKLLEEKHKDHYKIYNLCSERSYDIQKFHSRVSVYPFDDHNPPEFGQMRPFCEDVARWLDEHEKNVAVVHCKAGKGRTGLMICAYLLHCKFKCSANEVLEYYAKNRTADSKGVTIPSQRRYVDYYANMISESLQYNPVKMYLTSIVIDPLPQLQLGQAEGYIQFEVRQTSVRPFVSEVYQVRRTDGRINIELPSALLIVGDIKIEFSQKIKLDVFNFSQKPKYISSGPKLFHFWVNTFFIDQQRSSSLTHSCPGSQASQPRSPAQPSPAQSWQQVEDRNCRSTHNSGGTLGPDSPLPPPRALRHTLSSGDSRTSDPASQGSSEDQSDDHSPNGSCLSSAQTIHSHPPAKTVSIVEHYTQVGNSEASETDISGCESIKQMSISADEIADSATHQSFITKRSRHSSVPQTARPQAPGLHTRSRRNIPAGRLMSVRLNKTQIDKAAKDKSGKFHDNFNVTLFLVRPNDQTLQEEFSRSNMICQRGAACESSEESSEEEPAVLRRPQAPPPFPCQEQPVVRTLSAHAYPPLAVAVASQPANRLSEMTLSQSSQSTWI